MMEDSNRDLLGRLFPDEEKELENDTEVNQYLAKISTFGVEKLRAEGGRIQEEMAHTLQQTQDLAFQNYKTFVETAECSSAVLREFRVVEESLDHLLTELPEFGARCAEFGRRGAEIHARRRLNSATLAKHTQLLEVLELPQLMDTGVRNGYYDQAMELVTYVRGLQKKHGHIPLVQAIVTDVQVAYRLMLSQLVSQLRTNIQLPQCLKVIGHLRRMEVYTEFELRLKFLQARNAWLDEQLSNISRDDPYHHISKTIEVSRVSLFDIVTQYRAVFSDDSALLQAADDQAAPAIFYEWINLKVEQFLATLSSDLERGVGGRLDSVLSQTMYFGLSLARIGADLRPLAAPLFRRAALARFSAAARAAADRFRAGMDAFTCMKARAAAPPTTAESTTTLQESLQPPLSLLDYLPLAHYCNGLLTAFNELRLCPALSLVHEVTELVRASLADVVARVVDLYHTDSQGLTEPERLNYGRFCRCLARDLVPYLNTCLAAVFPADQLAPALGLSVAQLRKREVGALDVAALVLPLQEFLVQTEPPPALRWTPGDTAPTADSGPGAAPTADSGPGAAPTADIGGAPTANIGPGAAPTADIGAGAAPTADIGAGAAPTANITTGIAPAFDTAPTPGKAPVLDSVPTPESGSDPAHSNDIANRDTEPRDRPVYAGDLVGTATDEPTRLGHSSQAVNSGPPEDGKRDIPGDDTSSEDPGKLQTDVTTGTRMEGGLGGPVTSLLHEALEDELDLGLVMTVPAPQKPA